MGAIIIYGKISTTDGYEYLLGYEEGNPCTASGLNILIKSPKKIVKLSGIEIQEEQHAI